MNAIFVNFRTVSQRGNIDKNSFSVLVVFFHSGRVSLQQDKHPEFFCQEHRLLQAKDNRFQIRTQRALSDNSKNFLCPFYYSNPPLGAEGFYALPVDLSNGGLDFVVPECAHKDKFLAEDFHLLREILCKHAESMLE